MGAVGGGMEYLARGVLAESGRAAAEHLKKKMISDIWQKQGLDIWQKWGD